MRGTSWRAGVERLIANIEEEDLKRVAAAGSGAAEATVTPSRRGERTIAEPDGAATSGTARSRFPQVSRSWRWAIVGGVAAVVLAALGIGIATHGGGPSPEPTHDMLTFLGSTEDPTVVVSGRGFGAHPPIGYPASNTQCGYYANNGSWFGENGLWFRDATHSWIAGQGTSREGSCIGLVVVSWSPTQVSFRFGNAYNTFDHWAADSGDTVAVTVNGRTLSGTVRF
jgi:hypothetical protein